MTVFNRDHKRRPRIMPPDTWLLALLILLIMLASGCTAATHNAAGGYTDACGELPGMLGDDC